MSPIINAAHLDEAKRLARDGDPSVRAALDALIARADDALARGPFSVMDKTLTPPSGDKHDYMSFGPYWWPDPEAPDGLPYIRRDGDVNPASADDSTDRPAMTAMATAVHALALAFHFTDEARYADRARLLLKTWYLDPATRMNPDLEYGQAIPGKCDGRGIGIIDTAILIRVADALALLERGDGLTPDERAGIVQWFEAYLDWLLGSSHGHDERSQHNNHGTWYDTQVARFALVCGRDDLARDVVASAGPVRIAPQVGPDGAQPLELARTRSFSYSVMNLRGYCSLALMGDRLGVDLWGFVSPEGASIRAAIEYLLPYADPAKEWPHPQMTDAHRVTLVPVLRSAAVAYREVRYRDACASLGADTVARDEHRLILPDQVVQRACRER